MERYEGATMIKTFRGLIADGAQDTVVLHTNNGEMGYRVVNFKLVTATPGTASPEHVMKIYKVPQTTIDGTVDFSDNTLLGVGLYLENSGAWYGRSHTIFDQEVFNQDIYITHVDAGAGTLSCNYYLELEQVKLDLGASTVATLKDIRNLEQPA